MRHVSESAVEQTQIVLASHINGAGRLFGGQLMEWIDIVAGVVARRHSHCNQTTASVDSLQFKEAVYMNDTLILFGKLTYVGHTSMEVQVDTYVEALDGTRKLVNTAYFVMVALDNRSGTDRGNRGRKSCMGSRRAQKRAEKAETDRELLKQCVYIRINKGL